MQAVHHVARPAAVHHVEQRGAGGVGNFGGVLAGEAEAHVILRQQHAAHACEVGRLVIAHPEQLGQREAGQHGIRGPLEDVLSAQRAVDRIHLGLAALVAPDERGADDAVGFVQDDEAVHLAGKADAAHLAAAHARFREHAADGFLRRGPPVAGVLLGPQRPLHAHVLVRGGEARAHVAAPVHQQRAAASGSDIDADPHGYFAASHHGRYAAP